MTGKVTRLNEILFNTYNLSEGEYFDMINVFIIVNHFYFVTTTDDLSHCFKHIPTDCSEWLQCHAWETVFLISNIYIFSNISMQCFEISLMYK